MLLVICLVRCVYCGKGSKFVSLSQRVGFKVWCGALGIDHELVASIRRHIAAEPSVTGKRYRGLGA